MFEDIFKDFDDIVEPENKEADEWDTGLGPDLWDTGKKEDLWRSSDPASVWVAEQLDDESDIDDSPDFAEQEVPAGPEIHSEEPYEDPFDDITQV